MKKLRTNLRKEDIALSKGYMRWYRVVENEVRLFRLSVNPPTTK